MTKFSGIKDIDYLIMENLNDKDLFNFCQTNKYINELSKDENFWKKRSFTKFNNIRKREVTLWKKYYMYRAFGKFPNSESFPVTYYAKDKYRVDGYQIIVRVESNGHVTLMIDETEEQLSRELTLIDLEIVYHMQIQIPVYQKYTRILWNPELQTYYMSLK